MKNERESSALSIEVEERGLRTVRESIFFLFLFFVTFSTSGGCPHFVFSFSGREVDSGGQEV